MAVANFPNCQRTLLVADSRDGHAAAVHWANSVDMDMDMMGPAYHDEVFV